MESIPRITPEDTLNIFLINPWPYGVVLTVFWLALTPFLSRFFHTKTFTPILIFGAITNYQCFKLKLFRIHGGTLSFGKKAWFWRPKQLRDSCSPLFLVKIGYSGLVFLSILLSVTISTILSWQLTRGSKVEEISPQIKNSTCCFFLTSTLNGLP